MEDRLQTEPDIANQISAVQSPAVNRPKTITVGAVLLVSASGAAAQGPTLHPETGKTYEISKSYETSQHGSDGSSGSSRGRDVILERVIGVRDGGLELEYDLPESGTAEDRARHWQFPVRIFRPATGSMQVLNSSELEARVEAWLKRAGWTRSMCGRWVFTWTAFQIECDPQSVVDMLKAYDLRAAELREGASYQDPDARAPGMLVRNAAGADGSAFAARLAADPDVVRRARAEADVLVGEIMQKPIAVEAALFERAKESVSGTIEVKLETDSAGKLHRRTRMTRLQIRLPDGRTESQTATETVERRPVPTRPADH